MKALRISLKAAILAAGMVTIGQSIAAQSFCTYIGDGLASTRRQEITELIPMDDDLAFAAWNGYYFDDMETFVGRVSTSGNLIWSKSFNMIAPTHEKASALLRTHNGNLIVASNGPDVFSLTKVNGTSGNLIGGQYYAHRYEIQELMELPSHHIIAFGTSMITGTVCAMEFREDLTFVQGTNTGISCDLQRLIRSGNNFYGTGARFIGPQQEGVVFQLNSNLSPVWVKSIPVANGNHTLNGIVQTSGGNLIVAGFDGYCPSGTRILLHYFLGNGTYVASKVISHEYYCLTSQDLKLLPNGNPILTGTSNSPSGRVLTVALDAYGNLIQANLNGYGIGRCLAFSSTNQLFVAGLGEKYVSLMGWQTEGYLARLNSQGNSCCSEELECTVSDLLLSPYSQPPAAPSPITISSVTQGAGDVFGQTTIICPAPAQRQAQVSEPQPGLFPNPATKEVVINVHEAGPATLQIFDLKGQMRMKTILNQGSESISVEDLENGLYMVRLTTDKSVSTHRLVISR